jgi:hypothetical protein
MNHYRDSSESRITTITIPSTPMRGRGTTTHPRRSALSAAHVMHWATTVNHSNTSQPSAHHQLMHSNKWLPR